VAGAAGLPQSLDQSDQGGRTSNLAVGNRRADARQFLHHNAAGANVEMPDFTVADFALPDSGRELDVDLAAVVIGIPWAPWRVVAFDDVAISALIDLGDERR
jgi:hypothetical protein